jgi:hypothetical protein
MKLGYMTVNGLLEYWDGTEKELQRHLISESGPDIRLKFSEGHYLPAGCTTCEAVLTVSGDFEIEVKNKTRVYVKPRTQITIVCEGEYRMSETIDIDARTLCTERMDELNSALSEGCGVQED